MRGHKGIALIGLAACLALLGACGGSRAAERAELSKGEIPPADIAGIPPLMGLDNIKSSAVVTDYDVDVTQPSAERHTQVAGENLAFLPPATELAYAIYRIDRPGLPLVLRSVGAGPLWLLAADFGPETWFIVPFVDGQAEIDLQELDDPLSPEGYVYAAVICEAGTVGFLESLQLAYDGFDWGLTASVDEHSITLTWNELEAVDYRVYRSTLPNDTAPYLVGTVIEQHQRVKQLHGTR